MATLEEEIEQIVLEVNRLARLESKLTGFCIGNTRKVNDTGIYFSPIRKTSRLIAGSVIVYDINQSVAVARAVDGKVDYVLVDTEKKISTQLHDSNNVGNVERAVRETVKKSRVHTYKGNDLTVDSIERMIEKVLSTYPRGLGGKRAAIIGAGNLGSKLALKLVERGMNVSLIRRDRVKLASIVTALNIIKPSETIARVSAGEDNLSIAQGADLLVGLTHGTAVITKAMIDGLAHGAVLVDGGKGCFEVEAILRAQELNIPIYRTDIRPGFEGHMAMVLETERIVEYALGRAEFDGVPVVSGGLLGAPNEVVVDNITDPQAVFGLANGLGDFVRVLDSKQADRLQAVHNYILSKRRG